MKGTWRRTFCCVSGRQLGCQSAEYIYIFRWVFFSLPFSCGKRPSSIPRSLTSPVASNMLVKMTVAFHFIIDTLPFRFCFRTSHTTGLLALLRRAPVALCTSCLGAAVALGAKRTCRMRGLTLAGPRCIVPPCPPGGQNHLSAVEYRGWCGRDCRRDKRGEEGGAISCSSDSKLQNIIWAT